MNDYGTLNRLFEILKSDTYIEITNKFTGMVYCGRIEQLKDGVNNFTYWGYDIKLLDIQIDNLEIKVTISDDIELL